MECSISNTDERDEIVPIVLGIGQIFPYMLGQFCVLLTFIFRMECTFVDALSIFAYSSKTMTILKIAVFCSFVLFVIAGALSSVRASLPIAATLIPAISFFILFIGVYSTIVVLFWKKLLAMMSYRFSNATIHVVNLHH